jgi:hypothetical protein
MKLIRSIILAALFVPAIQADECKGLVTSSSSGATHVNALAVVLQFRELA